MLDAEDFIAVKDMSTIHTLFKKLYDRLYSFRRQTEYESFDGQTVINSIVAGIFGYPPKEALEEIDKAMNAIQHVLNTNSDFSQQFYMLDWIKIQYTDWTGNEMITDSREQIPMTAQQRERIHRVISAELNNYKKELEKLKKFRIETTAGSNNNPQVPPPSTFEYHNLSRPDKVIQLYTTLLKSQFISMETVQSDFEQIFAGSNIPPKRRVVWTGTLGALKYLIRKFRDEGCIEHPQRSIWDITAMCFLFYDKKQNAPVEIEKRRIGTQQEPNNLKLLETLDSIIQAFGSLK